MLLAAFGIGAILYLILSVAAIVGVVAYPQILMKIFLSLSLQLPTS